MTCEIKKLQGLDISATYGGHLTSFSLALAGISSQIKATATIVGSTSTPLEGDDITVTLGDTAYKMQVGGYSAKGDGTSADTLTLQLYDTSNRVLDKRHIALNEEVPLGTLPSNISAVGRKYGPLPDPSNASSGLIPPSPDTRWGDLKHFYEKHTPACPSNESDKDRLDRADQNTKGATGKVLYGTETLSGVLGDILGAGSTLPPMDMDFKGSLRDCIVQFINAQALVAYWDMEREKVMIKDVLPVATGFTKLMTIAKECETISFSETIDFTNTLAKGALGSVTSNWQGEGGSVPGQEKSKYVKAVRLSPKFKYKKCKDKGSNTMTELKFDKEVCKAIQAAVTPKIFAGYAFQSAVGHGEDAGSRVTLLLTASVLCSEIELEGLNPDGVKKTIEPDWDLLLPEAEAGPEWTSNSFLAGYYEPDKAGDRVCAPLMGWVELGGMPKGAGSPGYDLKGMALTAAGGKADATAPQKAGQAKENAPKGWNQKAGEEPVNTMGKYRVPKRKSGSFKRGKILLKYHNHFEGILGPKGFTGDNDILRLYLLAIQKFQNRFYVIKEDGKQCETSSVNIKGKSYGYYITSEVQNSPQSFKPIDGYKITSINPFVPLGECGCGELKALAEACALMYLKSGTSLADVMGASPDPDNPIEALKAGKSGVAVIDFIGALEADSADDAEGFEGEGQKQKQTGLEILFNGNNEDGTPAVRRGVSLEETQMVDGVEVEVPQLSMHILVADPPEQALQDIPQISFTANAGQVDAGNLGDFQPAETIAGPTAKAVDDMLVDLGGPLGAASSAISTLLEDADSMSLGLWGVRDTDSLGDLIDLNGTIPEGFFAGVNGGAAFKGAPFIPAASLSPPDAKVVRVWFRVPGGQNSFNSAPGEFAVSSMAPPKEGCWKEKIDYGISVNAADIGRGNSASGYAANSSNQGNSYSAQNKSLMTAALNAKLAAVAGTGVSTPSESKTLTYIMTESIADKGLPMPTMEDGLEALSLSLSGTKTQVTITVGNSVQMKATAAIADRMVQSPSTLNRPGAVMGDSLFEGASPKFLNFLNGN